MLQVAILSGYAGATAFAILSALLLAADKGHKVGRFLIAACVLSTIWFGIGAAYYSTSIVRHQFANLELLEILRDIGWLAFLTVILQQSQDDSYNRRIRKVFTLACIVALVAAALGIVGESLLPALLDPARIRKVTIALHLGLAVTGLVLVEQLIRSTRQDARWAIKHLTIGVGALFAFDFYLYVNALLFNRIDPVTWSVRGFANCFAVPLIALSAARNRDWNLDIFVSRRVVFYSAAAIGAGIYLLLMSVAGYYLNSIGGTWGAALRAAFLFGALICLVTLIFSSQVRSHLRIFLAKHFYKNRYEYGEVWLSFTRQLSASNAEPQQLRTTILRAIADIVDSTGGILWEKTSDGDFVIDAYWSMEGDPAWKLNADHPFVLTLEAAGELIDFSTAPSVEAAEDATHFPWLRELRRAWIAVPVIHGTEMLAFFVLADPRTNESITREDRELLRTVASQAASYLAFLRATEALTQARQFEAFNRLSAFLVHDLKNVVAQLSLIVRNAEKHKANPEFIADAFQTVGDAVAKINRMLMSLRQGSAELNESSEHLNLKQLIEDAVANCRSREPCPTLVRMDAAISVRANHDRLSSVIEHLVQNAPEATPDDGFVRVTLAREGDTAEISIHDSGCGMDEEFIRTRLFRPFDTTKGKAGMGIGVYESRHIVAGLGGRIEVTSAVGEGTEIRILLPCLTDRPVSATVTEEPMHEL